MGYASEGPLLVDSDVLLDPKTLRKLPMQVVGSEGEPSTQNPFVVHASADGKTFGGTPVGSSFRKFLKITAKGGDWSFGEMGNGYPVPTGDGKYLCESGALVELKMGPPTAEQGPKVLDFGQTGGFVAEGGDASLVLASVPGNKRVAEMFKGPPKGTPKVQRLIDETYQRAAANKPNETHGVYLFHVSQFNRPVFVMELPMDALDEERSWENPTIRERRFHLIPEAKLVVAVTAGDKGLLLKHFDVEEALKKAGLPGLK
jgi:hypothetical protein